MTTSLSIAVGCVARIAVATLALMATAVSANEIAYPAADFAKLDTFEALNIEEADKLFAKGDFTGAYAGYRAHSLEYTKSAALPYVLLRMGRCLHRLDKRNAAIKAYQDVIDYFPNDVVYAAAALYRIGECHGQNGEDAKQTAAWAKLVKDDDYVSQPQAGSALTFLAKRMAGLGKFDEAVEYQWRTAVTFLKSNPQAAEQGRREVIHHYAIRSPNHDKLEEFYTAAGGFDGRAQKVDDPENDARYWSTVLAAATGAAGDLREQACRYWTAKIGSRFPEDDKLRKLACDVQLGSDNDSAGWLARMEKQFASKPATLDRVFQWCEWLRRDPQMAQDFYAKHGRPLTSALTDQASRLDAMNRLRRLRLDDEAVEILRTTRLDGLDDPQILALAAFAAHYDSEEGVLRYFGRIKDPLTAAKGRFDYYQARTHRNPPFMEKALAEIATLEKSPQYAGPALTWTKATLLQGLGRYEEAIKVYREANRQPQSTWGIADCLVALKQFPQAVQTVTELEAVGGPVAAQAALKVADVYRVAGEKGKEVAQLRTVLKRYPKSGESSTAHNRLEAYGVPLVGGEASAEE